MMCVNGLSKWVNHITNMRRLFWVSIIRDLSFIVLCARQECFVIKLTNRGAPVGFSPSLKLPS